MNHKLCIGPCQQIKSVDQFYKAPQNKDGYTGRCKECIRKHGKTYRQNNVKKLKIRKQNYYNENKEIILEKQKQNRLENGDEIRAKDRAKYAKDPEKKKKSHKKWKKKKRMQDPIFKLDELISKRVREQIKKAGGSKNYKSTKQYLSQSPEEIWHRLEILFNLPSNLDNNGKSWMTIENWTTYTSKDYDPNDSSTWVWHLDHIVPRSHFKYETMEDERLRQCWDIDNLRPLKGKQNVEDKNKRTPEQIEQIKKSIKDFLEAKSKNIEEAA